MKKIIAFSLWGDNPKYTVGLIKNLDLAKEIYPGWICRVYCGKSVPENIISEIEKRDNKELIIMDEQGDWEGMFWRFFAAEDADIMISRDSDSRLNNREKAAVEQWSLFSIGFFAAGFCWDLASRSMRRMSASASATSDSVSPIF